MFVNNVSVAQNVLSEKTSRKILGMGGSLMMVEVAFAKGGVGDVHAHEGHEQVSYVVRGRFEVTVGGEKQILAAGDSFYAGLHVPHGVIALEDGVLLDVFTPVRADFL